MQDEQLSERAREAGRRLAAMGGTMPTLREIPRRRVGESGGGIGAGDGDFDAVAEAAEEADEEIA